MGRTVENKVSRKGAFVQTKGSLCDGWYERNLSKMEEFLKRIKKTQNTVGKNVYCDKKARKIS